MAKATVTLIDDSTFVQDPKAPLHLEGNLFLTEFSLRRLGNPKNYPTDFASRNAEQACNFLEELTFKNAGKIQSGMEIEGNPGTTLSIYVSKGTISEKIDKISYIIKVARELQRTYNVIIKSQERALIVRARIEGFEASIFRASVSRHNMYTGHMVCSSACITGFTKSGDYLSAKNLDLDTIYPNQCVTFADPGLSNVVTRTIFDAQSKTFRVIRNGHDLMPIRPLNLEQEYEFDLLMDPNLSIVSIDGEYGTGKDFPALAYGLAHIARTKGHARVVLISPSRPVGEHQHETLPGDMLEKNIPWMLPFMDNLNSLNRNIGANPQWKKIQNIMQNGLKQMVANNYIEVAPIAYIRGRTLDDCVVISTEAQNLDHPDVELIISRLGENAKLIFTGDISQLDNGYDFALSGFTRLIDSYKNHERVGHIRLMNRIRTGSDLAKYF